MVKHIYKYEGFVSVDGVNTDYDLWSLDLSAISQTVLIVEVTTTLYDERVGHAAIRYSTTGLYKGSSIVTAYVNQAESQYVHTQGDSRPKQIEWNQTTSVLSQKAEVLGVLDYRNIKFSTKITIAAF